MSNEVKNLPNVYFLLHSYEWGHDASTVQHPFKLSRTVSENPVGQQLKQMDDR